MTGDMWAAAIMLTVPALWAAGVVYIRIEKAEQRIKDLDNGLWRLEHGRQVLFLEGLNERVRKLEERQFGPYREGGK